MEIKSKTKNRLIFAAAAVVLLFLLSPLYMNGRRPNILCAACHEVRSPYLSWRTSTHRKFDCSNCHSSVPSAYRMIWGHFTGASVDWEKRNISSYKTCIRCHGKITGTVYFHSIKFPHEQHRKYIGDCRVCHQNVVHGSRNEYRNPPKKKTCYKCHDDRTASRDCKLCHLSFTSKLPQQLDPQWIASHKSDVAAFKTACVKCHEKKFCVECHKRVNPHASGWIKSHRKTAGKTTSRCEMCHTAADCSDCHDILNQHKSHWYDGHRRLALVSTKLCYRCHDKNFCQSCHAGITTHKPGWLNAHKSDPAAIKRTGCATCHTDLYCKNCHIGKYMLHHKGNWLSDHGGELSAAGKSQTDIEACISCHVPNFCLSCHRGVRKNVHSAGYTEMHRNASAKSMAQCKACHTVDSCNKCHKTSLPADHKDPQWKDNHGISAIKNMDTCTVCHERPFCEACHNKKLPASHEAKDWGKRHGSDSRSTDARCSLCHDNAYCNTCHRRNKPPDHYRDSWPQIHGRAALADMNNCLVCHDKNDCARCHGANKTHQIPGWMKNHDVSKQNQSFAKCAECHWLGTCVDCHQNFGLKGHADCTGCHASMSNPKQLKPSPCKTCHTTLPKEAVHKKHESNDCAICHKQHSFTADLTVCTTCHRDKNKDHTMGNPCTDCHPFK